MSVDISWYLPNRIAIARSYGANTIEDVLVINQWLAEHYQPQTGSFLYLITDAREVESNEMTLSDLMQLRSMARIPPLRTIILIQNTKLKAVQNMLATVASQMTGIRFRSADSLEEALNFLAEFDPEIEGALQEA